MSVNSENFSKLFWKKKIETILSILNTLIYRRKLGDYEISNTIAKTYDECKFKEAENGKS